jgi:hypothetical protein
VAPDLWRRPRVARQPYYRWLAAAVADAQRDEAHVANAVFDAHRDDPEFGYRFLADEVRLAGHDGCDRTVWWICRCSQARCGATAYVRDVASTFQPDLTDPARGLRNSGVDERRTS